MAAITQGDCIYNIWYYYIRSNTLEFGSVFILLTCEFCKKYRQVGVASTPLLWTYAEKAYWPWWEICIYSICICMYIRSVIWRKPSACSTIFLMRCSTFNAPYSSHMHTSRELRWVWDWKVYKVHQSQFRNRNTQVWEMSVMPSIEQ